MHWHGLLFDNNWHGQHRRSRYKIFLLFVQFSALVIECFIATSSLPCFHSNHAFIHVDRHNRQSVVCITHTNLYYFTGITASTTTTTRGCGTGNLGKGCTNVGSVKTCRCTTGKILITSNHL